ncbi:MAG: hypothetical protein DRH20_02460 [Deltaproteobacteria bacterium]|nr:MAG: hypothetical protein DRH20_02415 [Deltaproteobacteria bacterium]RLB39967.1 MAG: hypothetical protein DRH20_02460 [Deltaproteobacteria bacterium]
MSNLSRTTIEMDRNGLCRRTVAEGLIDCGLRAFGKLRMPRNRGGFPARCRGLTFRGSGRV